MKILSKCFILLNCLAFLSPLIAKDDATTPINVVGAYAQKLPVTEHLDSFGNLAAKQKVVITSEVDGKIVKINFDNGAEVKKGQTILEIDDAKAQADLASSQADLELAVKTYQRYQALAKTGGVSTQDIDKAKADMDNKKTTVQNDLVALQKYTLKAGFNGELGSFKSKVGDYLAAGDDIVTLLNKSPLELDYSLPQDTMPKLKVGQNVYITVSALPDLIFQGQVNYVSPSVDPDTGTVRVQARIPNQQRKLAPGMFAQIQQVTSEDTAIFIPEQTVQAGLSGTYVYKIASGKAIKTIVKLGSHQQGYVRVTDGLKDGDQIVAQGQQKLSDKQSITVNMDLPKAHPALFLQSSFKGTLVRDTPKDTGRKKTDSTAKTKDSNKATSDQTSNPTTAKNDSSKNTSKKANDGTDKSNKNSEQKTDEALDKAKNKSNKNANSQDSNNSNQTDTKSITTPNNSNLNKPPQPENKTGNQPQGSTDNNATSNPGTAVTNSQKNTPDLTGGLPSIDPGYSNKSTNISNQTNQDTNQEPNSDQSVTGGLPNIDNSDIYSAQDFQNSDQVNQLLHSDDITQDVMISTTPENSSNTDTTSTKTQANSNQTDADASSLDKTTPCDTSNINKTSSTDSNAGTTIKNQSNSKNQKTTASIKSKSNNDSAKATSDTKNKNHFLTLDN